MYDRFHQLARQEIQTELDDLEGIIESCNNDEHIFQNSEKIESHLHKIKGLAPMMEQETVGQIAKILDTIMKHIMKHGVLINSYRFTKESIDNMRNIFSGQQNIVVDDFIEKSHKMFTQISSW